VACYYPSRITPVPAKDAFLGSVPAQPELKKSAGYFFKEAKAASLQERSHAA